MNFLLDRVNFELLSPPYKKSLDDIVELIFVFAHEFTLKWEFEKALQRPTLALLAKKVINFT